MTPLEQFLKFLDWLFLVGDCGYFTPRGFSGYVLGSFPTLSF